VRLRLRALPFLVAVAVAACHASAPSPPPASSSAAPAPDPSACVAAVAYHQRALTAHLDAARLKTSARDGAGCLAELDAYDKDAWTPTPSTSPASAMAMSRAMCTMLAGDCAGGKALYRAAMAASAGASMGPEMLARSVDAVAAMYCTGDALAPRDALLKALMDLNRGAYMETTTSAACEAAIDAARRALPQVTPSGPDDSQVTHAPDVVRIAGPTCLARAGDCAAAWRVFHDAWTAEKGLDEATVRKMFGSVVKGCGS
jgi:hypothetical protein